MPCKQFNVWKKHKQYYFKQNLCVPPTVFINAYSSKTLFRAFNIVFYVGGFISMLCEQHITWNILNSTARHKNNVAISKQINLVRQLIFSCTVSLSVEYKLRVLNPRYLKNAVAPSTRFFNLTEVQRSLPKVVILIKCITTDSVRGRYTSFQSCVRSLLAHIHFWVNKKLQSSRGGGVGGR